MRIPIRLVPGWRGLVLIGAPIVTAIAFLVAAYAYTRSATAVAAPAAVADPVLEVPEQSGLLVDIVGAVERSMRAPAQGSGRN